MKIAILGAVHGTSEKEKLIFKTYQSAVELKFESAEIFTPDTVYNYKNDYATSHKDASETEVLSEMVKFDLLEVKSCELILADISLRSTGLGLELAGLLGINNGASVKRRIIFFVKDGSNYSDMIKGAFPLIPVYKYKDSGDLADILNKVL